MFTEKFLDNRIRDIVGKENGIIDILRQIHSLGKIDSKNSLQYQELLRDLKSISEDSFITWDNELIPPLSGLCEIWLKRQKDKKGYVAINAYRKDRLISNNIIYLKK